MDLVSVADVAFISIPHFLWIPDMVSILDLVSVPDIASAPECDSGSGVASVAFSKRKIIRSRVGDCGCAVALCINIVSILDLVSVPDIASVPECG